MIKIILGIDGMACGMCEAHVNDVIRKNFTIKKVKSSARKNRTEITAPEMITEEDLKKVLDPTGYRVISYEVVS